jgi:acyl-coenzyme A thioesterase PaaI-like protein
VEAGKMTALRTRLRFLNFYPPLVGAGIRVESDSQDPFTMRVRMPLTPFNGNVYGTHFGGSLYAMCDPFFALILLQNLGAGYSVWDKAATIQFVRPGRGTVRAVFHIPPAEIAEIRRRADEGETLEPRYQVDVMDTAGQVVAHVDKLLHVRRKN